MNKLTLIAALMLITPSAFAGFITNPDPNGTDMNMCKKNHTYILKKYANELDSQIAMLAKGVHFEVLSKTSEEKIKAYRTLLVGALTDRIILTEMNKQLAAVNFEAQYGKDASTANRVKKVFYAENVEVDLEFSLHQALEHAIEKTEHSETFKHYALHTLEHDLLIHSVGLLSVNTFKSIGKGVMAKIVTGSFSTAGINGIGYKAILSFGHHVIEGALVGAVVNILTEPLKGGRDSPEGIWTKMLAKNPEFIINPEWMNQLGSQDHPWETHCRTIHRQEELMEKYLKKFVQAKSADLSSKLMSIYQSWDALPVVEQDGGMYITPVDNTNAVINVPYQESLPIWARGGII